MDLLRKFDNPNQLVDIAQCDATKARKRQRQDTKRQKAKRARYFF